MPNSAPRDSADPAEIFEFLSPRLDSLALAEFGSRPRAQVRMQLENLRARLRRAAEVQAARRADGWRITDTEREFSFSEGGFEFAGRIDRIDARESGGGRNSPFSTTRLSTKFPAASPRASI